MCSLPCSKLRDSMIILAINTFVRGGGGVGTREHWAPRKHQNKPGCSQGNQADAGSVQFSYVAVQLFEYIFFKFISFILFLPCTKKKAPPSKKKKRDSILLSCSSVELVAQSPMKGLKKL